MDALYAIDGEANQRLIDEEAARRRDLIDQAVSSYAPTLKGKQGVCVVHLYSTNASLRKFFRDEVGGPRTIVVEHCLDEKERKNVHSVQYEGVYMPLPKRADLVATKSALSSKVEWLAARLGALPLCLPEAHDYLDARLHKVGALVIVGGDQA